jgi:photosystem II stability/assembly factor-like uncharacterized protein
VVLLALQAFAQTWVPLGPQAGDALCFAVDPRDPNNVMVGTDQGGAFFSSNAGQTWVSASEGLSVFRVEGLAADPVDQRSFWAATTSGLFRTNNNGAIWLPVNSGQPPIENTFKGVTFDETDPATLYLLPYSKMVTAAPYLLRSTDHGMTFTRVEIPGSTEFIESVVARGNTLVAAVSFAGVHRSTDRGMTWTRIYDGRVVEDGGANIRLSNVVAVDPTNANVIYVGSWRGLMRTTNTGATWTEVLSAPSGFVYKVVVTSTGVWTAIGPAVYFSATGQAPFTAMATGLGPRDVLSLADGRQAGRFFAGTRGDGVYRTTNGGMSFTATNSGIGATNVRSVLIDPSNANTLYVGTATSGAYKSADRGTTWARMPLSTTPFDAVDAIGATGATLYAVVNTPIRAAGSVHTSTNSGTTWTQVGQPLGVLWGANIGSMGPTVAQCGDQAYRYAGTTWVGLSQPGQTCILSMTTFGQSVYGVSAPFSVNDGGVIPARLMVARDGGSSWTALSGLPPPSINGGYSIFSDSRALYLAVQGPPVIVYVSRDEAQTWQALRPVRGELETFAADPRTNVLYVSTSSGVFASPDEGQRWYPIHQTLPIVRLTTLVPANGATEDVLYAGTGAKGLYVLRGALLFDGGHDDSFEDGGVASIDAGLDEDGGAPEDGGTSSVDGATVVGSCGCSSSGSLFMVLWSVLFVVRRLVRA